MEARISLSLSHSLHPRLCHLSLSHLSVCPLPVCLPVHLILLYRPKESASHPEWPSARRGLPSGHIGSRQTGRGETDGQRHRQTEGKRREEDSGESGDTVNIVTGL